MRLPLDSTGLVKQTKIDSVITNSLKSPRTDFFSNTNYISPFKKQKFSRKRKCKHFGSNYIVEEIEGSDTDHTEGGNHQTKKRILTTPDEDPVFIKRSDILKLKNQ